MLWGRLWLSHTAWMAAEVWKGMPSSVLECRKKGGGLNRGADVQECVWHRFWWKERSESPHPDGGGCFSLSSRCLSGLALEFFGSVDLGAFALLLLITTSLGLVVNAAQCSLGKLDLISAFTTEILMSVCCKWNLFEVFISSMFLIFWILNLRRYLICNSTVYLELQLDLSFQHLKHQIMLGTLQKACSHFRNWISQINEYFYNTETS